LLVATDNELLRVAPRGGVAPTRLDVDVRQIGQVTRVAIDDRTMFIAGTDGVLVIQRDGGLTQRLSIGRELPGAALDLVAHRDWLWIATVQGLVRVRRVGNGSLQ
jgi:ligand-binding sensor domain-containing protein